MHGKTTTGHSATSRKTALEPERPHHRRRPESQRGRICRLDARRRLHRHGHDPDARGCWGKKSTFDCPSGGQSFMNSLVADACFFGPFGNRHALTSAFNVSTGAFVSSLLCCGGPTAISRTVWAVVINSINGVFCRRRLSHIGKKVNELRPPFAHINSARAVIIKVGSINLSAAPVHKRPCVVFLCWPAAIRVTRLAVRKVCFAGALQEKTATRLRVFVAQFIGGNDCHLAAVTCARPMHPAGCRLRAGDNSKTGEFLTRKVYEFWHFVTWKLNTAKDTWQTAVIQFFGSYPSQVLFAFYHFHERLI